MSAKLGNGAALSRGSMPKPGSRPTTAFDLPHLACFDPATFISQDREEQKVFGFVLMLAHVYNDLHDLLFTYSLLYEYTPPGERKKSADWGHHSGLNLHVLRLIQAHFRETLYLIGGRKEEIAHPMFQAAIQCLNKAEKQCWTSLVEAAAGQAGAEVGEFRSFLDAMRNKLASHYAGVDQIVDGYKRKFFGKDGQEIQQAYISRAASMAESRFHFADAAAEGFLDENLDGREAAFRAKMSEFAKNINASIYSIVDKFIQNVRKTAYSEPRE